MNIKAPTLLVNEAKCRANIRRMVEVAKKANATLRPHFKTHQSATIASWFEEEGVTSCAVSSVSMALYFAEHGWKDISIAFPYNPLEAGDLNSCAEKARLNILIESQESLNHAKSHLKGAFGYYLKIDVGSHRTGLDPRDEERIKRLIDGQTDRIIFEGFMAHAGHTYGATGTQNIQWIFDASEKILLTLKDHFGGKISFGDTPSCSMMADLSMYDELRPGNFIFYDWMQKEIGSCVVEEVAVCMACPVVAKHPERNELVIYGGAVHLSKDSIGDGQFKSYGKAVRLTDEGWETNVIGNVARVSQEHGVVQASRKVIDQIKIGDLIGIIPVHSCLAADLQGHYLSTNGERIEKIAKN